MASENYGKNILLKAKKIYQLHNERKKKTVLWVCKSFFFLFFFWVEELVK